MSFQDGDVVRSVYTRSRGSIRTVSHVSGTDLFFYDGGVAPMSGYEKVVRDELNGGHEKHLPGVVRPYNQGEVDARLERFGKAIGEYRHAALDELAAQGQEIDAKPTNPKDAIGSTKLPLHLWPEVASAHGCLALTDGALKYGRANWRVAGVRASIYYDACRRHLNAWFEGENADAKSGLHPLAHALACLAIIVDAEAAGKLVDDRQFPGGYGGAVEALSSHVARLKALHSGNAPKHYTLADAAA